MLDLDSRFAHFVRGKMQNPHLQYAQIAQSACKWAYSDRLRIKTQLIDNIELIKNRRVLDLGCHDGILSEAMDQLGARSVIATNVRQDMIDLVNQCLKELPVPTLVTVIKHDLYDLDTLDLLLEQSDTIHFSGTVMHLNHHYQLFYHLCNNRPDHMILDSIYYDQSWHHATPLQTWRLESMEDVLFGHDQKSQTTDGKIFVGTPNLCWYRQMLDMFGWQLVEHHDLAYVHFEEKLRRRSVMVCQRRKKSP
jgi:hypothetical protein